MKSNNTFLLAIFFLLLAKNNSLGNTGAFFGAGNQVIPIKNSNVQFVSENVGVKLAVDQDSSHFGISIPWADVTAKFYFKNPTPGAISLQMGFPFPDLKNFGDEKYALENLHFKVVMNGTEINTQIKEGAIEKQFDPQGLFKKVFTWPASFMPAEKKEVVVTYRILMGLASASSVKRSFDEQNRKFVSVDKLIPALAYSFTYITKTAYTWAGPIEEAVFQLDSSAFYSELKKQSFLSGILKGKLGFSSPVLWESISPQTTKENGILRWVFKGKLPEDGLAFQLIMLYLPSRPSELEGYYTDKLPGLENISPDEFKDILKAYYQIIAFDQKPSSSFLQDYFKDLTLLRFPRAFVFETDRIGVEKIAEDFDQLTGREYDPASATEPEIEGSEQFIDQVQKALLLLKERDSDAYAIVKDYVGRIQENELSGINVFKIPPIFYMSDITAFASVTWCAASIAHDSFHSKLYHEYRKAHEGPVPSTVYKGWEAEQQCMKHQLAVMERIGASSEEIDHAERGADGHHVKEDGARWDYSMPW